jgi:thiol-disulfide isomerase/thioredoxin
MSKFVNSFLNYVRPYIKFLWLFLVVFIFVAATYFGYKKFAAPAVSTDKYKDVANANRRGLNADVYFFHVDWCPHCKTAAPEWKKFETEYNGKTINGYTIVTHDVDCTEDSADSSNRAVAEIIKKFNIVGYPTIKITTDDGKSFDFESKISQKSLDTFVNSVL